MYVIGDALPSEFASRLAAQLKELGVELLLRAGPSQQWGRSEPPEFAVVGLVGRDEPPAERVRLWRECIGREPLILGYVASSAPASFLDDALAAGADDCILDAVSDAELRLRLAVSLRRAKDRTKLGKIDERLRASMERFDLAVAGANEGLWDLTLTGTPWPASETKIWYSPRFKELLGFDAGEFPHVLESWKSRLHPGDRDRVLAAVRDHIDRKVTYDIEYRLRHKCGEYRWFSARGQAVWDETGRVTRMAGSLRDITATKEIDEKLRRSEERWRTVVQNAPALIVVATPEGIIEFVNRDSEMAKRAIGQSVYAFTEAPYHEVVREAFRAVVETGKPQRYEARGQSESNGIVWYSSRLGPLIHEGQVESVVLIAIDITRRKNAETLVASEREHLRRLLDLQERERQIVAYEIHDGMVQYLTGGIMHLESFASRSDLDQAARAEYERGVALLRESLVEARRLISGLRPPVLDELGVVAALEYLVNESRQWIADIEFVHCVHFRRLVAPIEVAIFRITQEALFNIRKHSGANRALVELRQHGNWVRLLIRDWGTGFDLAVTQEERFGLQGIRQRALLLKTIALIESFPGEGTAITIDFPLVELPGTPPVRETEEEFSPDETRS